MRQKRQDEMKKKKDEMHQKQEEMKQKYQQMKEEMKNKLQNRQTPPTGTSSSTKQ